MRSMNIIMKHTPLTLDDLPDEILLLIFKKINNIGLVYYSLFTVNKRFHQILNDRIFSSHLSLVNICSNKSIHPLPDPILDQYCLQVLPKIHRNIKWLNIDASSIERILFLTDYPNLYGLGLFNLRRRQLEDLFACEILLFQKLNKNKISSLIIQFTHNDTSTATIKNDTNIYISNILNMFDKLQYLNFAPCSQCLCQVLECHSFPSPISSSNLLELHVNLCTFTDCRYLLDGRFNQLRRFYVNISVITRPYLRPIPTNQNPIPNLQCFYLSSDAVADYDELIVPLLNHMINLEELCLNLRVVLRKTFLDGNNLINITNNMKRLNQLTFNISTRFLLDNETNLVSNETIQNTFQNSKFNKILSCVDYFIEKQEGQCLIYSYPYKLKDYLNITNQFPGGLFECVREISLFDECPFEHEFFMKISQSFPLLESLTVVNSEPQKKKELIDDNNRIRSIIEYPYLKHLDLYEAHEDYIEQFLLHTKTFLPYNLFFGADHPLVEKVTENFTRLTTRFNCLKMRYFPVDTLPSISNNLRNYFLHVSEN